MNEVKVKWAEKGVRSLTDAVIPVLGRRRDVALLGAVFCLCGDLMGLMGPIGRMGPGALGGKARKNSAG
ncbi:MAG: hypothetical protein B7Z37_15970 [Verrucomicrobia bacterium 12-59-8]|nr:MAG: hypothetical protein B7Z37_15970 [Verrucomicrobia bacterium 12-59-8]